MTATPLAYRPDIDGLRAVAMAIVVWFHARLGGLSGGFVGVDVFFVISGFLIASIIQREMQAGTFTLAGFYERRCRRILPALLLVTAATLAAGCFLLTPADLLALGKAAVATVAFHSNFHFARTAGYFMPASETLPLLHTWSLGVEEQFYVVAPLLLLALGGRWRRWRTAVFSGLLALSLGLAVRSAFTREAAAFYLPHLRAYELMLGMALALGLLPALRQPAARTIAAVVGIAMIGYAAVMFSGETPMPGWAALIPCLGTALIIHSGSGHSGSGHSGGGHAGSEPATLVHRLLAVRPLVYVGLVSYALYLWHWPLLAFAEYEWPGAVSLPLRLALVALAFALAVATYHWLETPVRARSGWLGQGRVFAGAAVATLALLAAGQWLVAAGGWPGRLPPEARRIAAVPAIPLAATGGCRQAEGSATGAACPIGRPDAAVRSFV